MVAFVCTCVYGRRAMTTPDDLPSTITIANLKGGCGKTTSTVFLAEAVAATGLSVAVLDTDPQATAAQWAKRAADAGTPLAAHYGQPDYDPGTGDPEPIGRAAGRLRASSGADVVIIDTPPGAGDRDITRAAVEASDGVIVPCRASIVEAQELRPMLRLADAAGRQAVVLRIAVDIRMSQAKAFGEVLSGAGIQFFRASIPYNARMLEAGGRRPDRLYGYQQVWAEIRGDDEVLI